MRKYRAGYRQGSLFTNRGKYSDGDEEGLRIVREYHHGSPEAEQLSSEENRYETLARLERAKRQPRIICVSQQRRRPQYTLYREKDLPRSESERN